MSAAPPLAPDLDRPAAVGPLARRLIDARRGGPRIADLAADERPADLDDAYRIAAEVAADLGPGGGWKIGATSAGAQAALGLAEPFFGMIPAAAIRPSGSTWTQGAGGLAIDAEIVFELAQAPVDGSPAALRAAVASIRLGLEVNDPSYVNPMALGGAAIVADNGAHAGLIVSEPLPGGADLDLAALAIRLEVDGRTCGRATGAAVLGDPWAALAWLVAALPARGRSLKAGDLIASGGVVATPAGRGSTVRAIVEDGPTFETVLRIV